MGHPPPIHQLQSTCVGEGSRVPNLQTEFNYLNSFKSYGIFSDFVVPVVPTLSLSSPHHPCGPHVIPVSSLLSPHCPHSPQKVPMAVVSVVSSVVSVVSTPCCPCGLHVIPTSSLCHPHHPHSPQKVPMWSPRLWSPWSLLSPWFHPMLSPWSLWSQHHPHHPHVIPVSSPHHPHSPQKVPMWSPWLWSPWSPLLSPWSPPHVPVVPTSSPCCPHHLEGPHIIPNPPDTHSTHPHPPGGWGSQISKNAIRFELIEIF